LGGKKILLDPVLSDHAAPLSFLNRAFAGTNIYTAEDFPEIDYLLISHEHWDHLDYPTAEALKEKINRVVCPL
ncbi:MAG: MBL fold metallo-hydrolase, partial [Desulfuromonadales bacterium]|nr:MBL fold metallo-hydrolase [Desulfuromonadales bacterium]NIS39539.1 MBL fold metallo-hydrolase [Desulfuromonadales bacterium]